MFSRATQTWFDSSFVAPTDVQRRGWHVIRGGGHALLVAPTGSGKTLAAFLAAIDSLATAPADRSPGVRVLYVSPLKALVYDVERNLRAP
ncbi:MAG: DEAD/DEAH box helicase, partial [Gemmatimonadetes bacterium]|nr:DEAD/DEAH box helicase [Gemmatimonadota bacterium]